MNLENIFKRFRLISDIVIILINIGIIGISLIPSILLLSKQISLFKLETLSIIKLSIAIASSYVIFGICLLVLTGILKFIFRLRSKTGVITMNSPQILVFTIYHNLIHLCDVFILKFIRSTSIINWYFKIMGAKIGKGTIINTTRISDCDIISIGADCVIGGDAVINGHSVENGKLYRERVIIGDNVTIGQYATILPGVLIEDNVIVGANTVVPKGKILKKNSIYVGNLTSKLDSKQPSHSSQKEISPKLLFKNIDNADLLSKSYTLRHSEILSIERFLSQVTISTLGLVVSLVMYSILNNQPKLILLLPTLVGFSYAIIINLTISMLKLGANMYQIELFFKKLNVMNFNWEMKDGILGSARNIELDNIFFNIIYFAIFIGGCYLIYNDTLIDETALYAGYSLKKVLLYLDGFIVIWILFSFIYFFYKKRKFMNKVKDYEHSLENLW